MAIELLFRTVRDDKLQTIETPKAGCWVVVENPTDEEVNKLVEQFKLDRDLLTDALDPYEVSRIEKEDGKDYVFTRFPYQNGTVTTSPLLIVVADDHLITVSKVRPPFMDKFRSGTITTFTTQKIKTFIQIFLEITQEYQRTVNSIRKSIRSASVNMENIKNRDIVEFVNFENIFNELIGSLEPTNVTLSKLLSGNYFKLYEVDKDLIEDLFLSNSQLIDLIRSNLKQMVNIREAYSTIISNNLNRTMKLLTSLTLILTVPTIVASLFGMNVPVPLQDHPLAFLIIILGTVGISASLLALFWRKDYL